MRVTYIAYTAAALMSLPAMANDEMPAACVAMAMQIGTETGSEYIRTSSVVVFFRPPLPKTTIFDNELTVGCEPYFTDPKNWSIHLTWSQSASPPPKYYEVLGSAGVILTGEAKSTLITATKTCVRSALGHKSELEDELTPKAKIECQAFARDGGSVSVSVFPRQDSDEKTDWSE